MDNETENFWSLKKKKKKKKKNSLPYYLNLFPKFKSTNFSKSNKCFLKETQKCNFIIANWLSDIKELWNIASIVKYFFSIS